MSTTKSCLLWVLPYPITSITMAIMTQTMIPARKRRRTMKSRLVSIAMTNPLERGDSVRSFQKKLEGDLQMLVSDSHQDPVPGLCVILKDFHDHLTSLNNHSSIPVERVEDVYSIKHCEIRCQANLLWHAGLLRQTYLTPSTRSLASLIFPLPSSK